MRMTCTAHAWAEIDVSKEDSRDHVIIYHVTISDRTFVSSYTVAKHPILFIGAPSNKATFIRSYCSEIIDILKLSLTLFPQMHF